MSENEISRREFNLGVAAGAAAIGSAGRALAQTREPFDLVILGGRVMDPETGFDQIANVGVRAGRIMVAPGAKRREAAVTLYGALASLLDFAIGAKDTKATANGGFCRVFMVAGAGFEPAAFRL